MDLEVNATNATDTVEFIAHNSIWNLSFDATDSDGTDGFSTIMEGLEMGIYQLQANAYDEEGYLIDEASSLLLYLALGA